MEKYLVFRLEKEVSTGEEWRMRQECFELIKEFQIPKLSFQSDRLWQEVVDYAEDYALSNGLRTVVIKGTVFGV